MLFQPESVIRTQMIEPIRVELVHKGFSKVLRLEEGELAVNEGE